MTVWCFGSINADHFFYVPHLPRPGETLAAHGHMRTLGGKGANQTVAAAKAGSHAIHLGAIGPDGDWMLDLMAEMGVETGRVSHVAIASGQAQIYVDDAGENSIVIYPGANREQETDTILAHLSEAKQGDILLIQNETSEQDVVAKAGKGRGMTVIYSAAPFDVTAVRLVLPYVDILAMNAIEEEQLAAQIREVPNEISRLVTLGAEGALWKPSGGAIQRVDAHKVEAVDTTGAGDTFAGYFAAGLDQGMSPEAAMRLAAAASALKVQKKGTAEAIPTRAEVDAFLNG